MFSHCFTYTIVQVDEPLQFDFIYFQNSTNSVNFCISILFSSFLQQKETIGKPASNGLQVRNGCIPAFCINNLHEDYVKPCVPCSNSFICIGFANSFLL